MLVSIVMTDAVMLSQSTSEFAHSIFLSFFLRWLLHAAWSQRASPLTMLSLYPVEPVWKFHKWVACSPGQPR